MTKLTETEFGRRLQQLMAGPVYPEKHFLLSSTTYRQLYAMAAHIRAYFGSADASDRVVCLCADNRAVTTAAVLATLAGGPALVLPYAFNPDVLQELQDLTGFDHAIIDGPRVLPPGVQAIQPSAAENPWPPVTPSVPIDPEKKFIHLFTGGTTGTPRLWPKTVSNLLGETFYLQDTFQVTADDRVAATVCPFHIYGLLYSILLPLVSSASVSADTPSFPAEIEATLHETAATILISVPAHYRVLNGYPFTAPDLRLAFSSAGVLAEQDGDAFSARTDAPIVEIYGSTETGGVATRSRATGQTAFRPYDSIDFRIEEESIWIRSDYLSPGLADPSDGFFRMGDRAVAADRNQFKLLGRADGIVKVGGKRVDLEAVRQKLKQDPRIEDAVVLALNVGRARENQVVAVVEAGLDEQELAILIRNSLEPYACPRRFKIVDKIPVTSAGKYDRKAIEALF